MKIYKRGKVLWLRYTNEFGRRVRVSTETSDPKTAQMIAGDILKKAELVKLGLAPKETNRVEIKPLFQEYKLFLEGTKRPSHVKSAKAHLANLLAETGVNTVQELTPQVMERFLLRGRRGEHRRQIIDRKRYKKLKPGWSARTANLALTIGKAFLNWAKERKRILNSPLEEMRRLKGDLVKKRRALTEDEVQRLLEAAKEPYRTIWAFLLMTGCRLNEALTLTRNDLDLFRGEVHIRSEIAKTHEGRTIPLAKKLKEMLQANAAGKGKDQLVLPTGNGTKYLETNLIRAFRSDLTRAEIPSDKTLDLHSCRKTFVTSLARAGVNPAVAQKLAGHKSLSVTLGIYAEVNGDDQMKAVERLTFLTEKTPDLKVEEKKAQ